MEIINGIACINEDDRIWRQLSDDGRDLLLKYKGANTSLGFYGNKILDDWKNKFGLIDLDDVELVKNDLASVLKENPQAYVIFLTSDLSYQLNSNLFSCIGYDVLFDVEYDEPIFSGIINEIGINGNSYVKNFSYDLNENYLFDNVEMCHKYLKSRNEAFEKSETDYLETAYPTDMFRIYKIHLFNTIA